MKNYKKLCKQLASAYLEELLKNKGFKPCESELNSYSQKRKKELEILDKNIKKDIKRQFAQSLTNEQPN